MKLLHRALVTSALTLLAISASAQDASADAVIQDGLAVLSRIDQDKLDDVWEGAAPFIKLRFARATLSDSIRAARASVGPVAQRTWASVSRVRFAQEEKGTPAGLYANIDFSTRRQDGRVVFELVSLMQQPDGSWRLTGYVPRQQQ